MQLENKLQNITPGADVNGFSSRAEIDEGSVLSSGAAAQTASLHNSSKQLKMFAGEKSMSETHGLPLTRDWQGGAFGRLAGEP